MTVLSNTEKEHVSLPGASDSDNNLNIKKVKLFDVSEVEMKASFVESKSSISGASIEPPTPMKKL